MGVLTLSETRIYVACLASYNNGILHGAWIDTNQDTESIQEEIQDMLKASSIPFSEEWAIHDYEGFGDISISEYEDIQAIAELSESINEHGEAFLAYVSHVGISDFATNNFEEAYAGEWESEVDFAQMFVRETMTIPENIEYYFDYEKYSCDLFINYYFSVRSENCKVYVFRNM